MNGRETAYGTFAPCTSVHLYSFRAGVRRSGPPLTGRTFRVIAPLAQTQGVQPGSGGRRRDFGKDLGAPRDTKGGLPYGVLVGVVQLCWSGGDGLIRPPLQEIGQPEVHDEGLERQHGVGAPL